MLKCMFSCTFSSNVNYEIINNTSESIDLIVEHKSDFNDTIRLEIDETGIFYEYHKEGGTNTVGTLNDLDSIRVVKNITIISASGKTNKNDLTRLEEWELIAPESFTGHGQGYVRKSLMDEDLK